MIRRPRALRLGVVTLLLACREGGGHDSVEAARADSSAAGYAVGGAATPAVVAIPPADTARRESTAVAARRDSTPRRTTGATVARATPRRDSARAITPRDTARAVKRDTAGHVATRPPAPSGPVRVNEFLTYDAGSRTASVQLIAGYNGVNGSLNYNGAIRGMRALAIPLGWHVHVTVSNRDTDLQHSAIVVAHVLPPPLELTTPAFEGAALPHLDEGLHEDETGTMDFVATRAGRYMLACGVPGHAQSGMWLQLVVAPGVTVPAYR